MATGTRYDVVLTDSQRHLLDQVQRSRTCPARQQRNATILLLRADGVPTRACAARVGCARRTITRVCRLFCDGGWDVVCTEQPRGKPPSYRDADRQRVLEWAQLNPQALGLAINRWSLRWLQIYWEQRLRRPAPARSTLQRWLRAAHIPWYRRDTFCRSNDPEKAVKTELVCDAYVYAPADWALLCYDQKPTLQALSRPHHDRPPIPDHPAQYDHVYQRHGTTDLHLLYDVRSGRCCHACRPDHRQDTIAALLGPWLRRRDEQKILLISDNLAAIHAPAVQAALDRTGKLVLVFRTPTYSSWLNQAERVFADLQRELLDRLWAGSVGHLVAQLRRWFALRNAHATPFNWTWHPGLVLDGTGH